MQICCIQHVLAHYLRVCLKLLIPLMFTAKSVHYFGNYACNAEYVLELCVFNVFWEQIENLWNIGYTKILAKLLNEPSGGVQEPQALARGPSIQGQQDYFATLRICSFISRIVTDYSCLAVIWVLQILAGL